MVFRRSSELDESLRRASQRRDDPLEAAQAVMWIALVIRKLSEAGEVSIATMRRTWPVRFHWRRSPVLEPRDGLSNAYELGASRPEELPLLRLCALLVHSYVFVPEDHGIYFTSDLEKDNGVFFLEWATVGQMVDFVCDDVPRSGVIHAA